MNPYKQRVVELYNSRTAYDSETGTTHPHKARRLLEFVPLQVGQTVLDVATGTGLVAIAAANIVGPEGQVNAIDLTPGMLAQASKKIAASNLQNIELIEADAESFSLNDNQFDAIFCCEALVLFIDIAASLEKWHRALKPGGFVAFTCPAETAYLAPVYRRICTKFLGTSIPHVLDPLGTPERCCDLLRQAGFGAIAIETEPSGRYRIPDDRSLRWKWIDLNFKGNPQFSALLQNNFDQFQAEYSAEMAALATDKGIWEDTTTFFVRACKFSVGM